MGRGEHSEEVDHLMEMEFRLTQDLNVIRRRLEHLLGQEAVGNMVGRHLHAVPDLPEPSA